MPYEIDLGMPPAGYVLKGAAREGEQATVQFMEFTSTEDGQHFIKRLEGFPNTILEKLESQKSFAPSQIDSILAIIGKDGKATVYVNELGQTATVRVNEAIEKGQRVTKDHIVDVTGLELDVVLPADRGVLYLFSVGWRKGLFYDFGPIGGPNAQPRQYDLPTILGRAYCHVLFQERFSISDDEWTSIFSSKWFPFAAMRNETIEKLIASVRSGLTFDNHIEQVGMELKQRLPGFLSSWKQNQSFADHILILERAVTHFLASDYLSCTGLLFPRIEGILRTYHTSSGVRPKPKPDNLTRTAVSSQIDNDQCLLLPRKFEQYLDVVYFADFNPKAASIDVSRHSVAHGVADAAHFNQKSAIIGIMVVHQLFYFLERGKQAGQQK
ncbi:MAG: hypothetical protein V1790_13330 [Planctomycetota bacterium]